MSVRLNLKVIMMNQCKALFGRRHEKLQGMHSSRQQERQGGRRFDLDALDPRCLVIRN